MPQGIGCFLPDVHRAAHVEFDAQLVRVQKADVEFLEWLLGPALAPRLDQTGRMETGKGTGTGAIDNTGRV